MGAKLFLQTVIPVLLAAWVLGAWLEVDLRIAAAAGTGIIWSARAGLVALRYRPLRIEAADPVVELARKATRSAVRYRLTTASGRHTQVLILATLAGRLPAGSLAGLESVIAAAPIRATFADPAQYPHLAAHLGRDRHWVTMRRTWALGELAEISRTCARASWLTAGWELRRAAEQYVRAEARSRQDQLPLGPGGAMVSGRELRDLWERDEEAAATAVAASSPSRVDNLLRVCAWVATWGAVIAVFHRFSLEGPIPTWVEVSVWGSLAGAVGLWAGRGWLLDRRADKSWVRAHEWLLHHPETARRGLPQPWVQPLLAGSSWLLRAFTTLSWTLAGSIALILAVLFFDDDLEPGVLVILGTMGAVIALVAAGLTVLRGGMARSARRTVIRLAGPRLPWLELG